MTNVQKIKKDFPIFGNNPGLVYLDSAATSLKPQSVIDKLEEYYSSYSANIYRGIYKISEKATEEYEKSRSVVADFIDAGSAKEVVFVKNATEGANLVSYGFGRRIISRGDEVAITITEHHSNFVPWQRLVREQGGVLRILDIDEKGCLRTNLKKIINGKTKIFSFTAVSNVLGIKNPVGRIIRQVKEINPDTITVVDLAQAVPHHKVSVKKLGADFVFFSSHKMLGPTGLGVLWGRSKLLKKMEPFCLGGEMVDEVNVNDATFKHPPYRFEAGTFPIGEVIAFKESVFYINKIGIDNIEKHEKKLAHYAIQKLTDVFSKKITILGPLQDNRKSGIVSFIIDGCHPHDLSSILNEKSICVRAGYHCAMPLHARLKMMSSLRLSFYFYNEYKDVDRLVEGLVQAVKILR